MDIQFHGANCISISSKQFRIVVDDNLESLEKKSILKNGDIVLYTGAHSIPAIDSPFIVSHPGEYEVSGVFIYGTAARGHMDEAGKKEATIFKIIANDVRIGILGHIYPELTERQLEQLGSIDVLFVPVGGNGYTVDPVGALKLIKKIEPKVVIPTHYHDSSLAFPVPQQTIEQAVSVLSMEPKETTDKLKIKAGDFVGETTQLVLLKPAS